MILRSLLSLGLCAVTLVSCSLFETTITRDLRAVWSPDGTSLLVVSSQYTTPNPAEIYYNATSGHDWRVLLDQADGTSPQPLSTRTPLDQFDENLALGGVAQYEPVYWCPRVSMVVFGGRTGLVRFVDTKTSWTPEPSRSAMETALGTVTEVEPSLTPAKVASDLELQDLVPSPDGTKLAGLYITTYLDGPEIGGEFYDYRVVVFWDVKTHAQVAARRVTAEVWHIMKAVNPHPELSGENQNLVWLSWRPDGQGVYAYVYQGYNPRVLTGTPPEPTTVPSLVVEVPVSGTPFTASLIPERPLPTASGAVSPSGVGYTLVVEGNKTTLTPQTIADWVPFGSLALESASTWFTHASRYNF